MVQEDFAGGLKVMSHPQKGMLQLMGGTVISSPWEQLLRIGENTLQGIRSFFLFTEGAISLFYRNRELTENGKDFLRRGTEVFGRILDQLEMEEDYSILEITIQGDK